MVIHQNNYEEFVLDYLDGYLSKEEEKAMKLFFAKHPEIWDEVKNLNDFKLPKPEYSYQRKDSLKRNSPIFSIWQLGMAAATICILAFAGFQIFQQNEDQLPLLTDLNESKPEEAINEIPVNDLEKGITENLSFVPGKSGDKSRKVEIKDSAKAKNSQVKGEKNTESATQFSQAITSKELTLTKTYSSSDLQYLEKDKKIIQKDSKGDISKLEFASTAEAVEIKSISINHIDMGIENAGLPQTGENEISGLDYVDLPDQSLNAQKIAEKLSEKTYTKQPELRQNESLSVNSNSKQSKKNSFLLKSSSFITDILGVEETSKEDIQTALIPKSFGITFKEPKE